MQAINATLIIDGQSLALQPGRANSFDAIYIDFREEEVNGGRRWSVFLHPKQDVTVQSLEIQFHLPLPAGTRFFANGYQSWSESSLVDLHATLPRLRRLARARLGYSGDERIENFPRGRGKLHSWTYTYFKKPAATLLAASLNEKTGFTLFLYDSARQILTVKKDLENLHLAHSFPALDFWIAESSEQDVFDGWRSLMEIPAPLAEPALGWTSWYRYFTHISEAVLLQNLNSVHESGLPFRYFQIDDGWQTATGDWFSTKPEFPSGMGGLARQIQSKGLEPGLWLAPFVAAGASELVRKHPEWLLKDSSGKPLKAGWNPAWGGWYYALDFYQTGVRDYLSGVFHTVLDKWGYRLVKLDFLFAACLHPPAGKTRGGVMWEVMEFLRAQVGAHKMLACGVPLGAAFGTADYCRIGPDIHLNWEHRLLSVLRFRERLSCLSALRTTIGRWRLNGRVFSSDPDVFILRSAGQHLSPVQQNTILTLNALLGALLFTSDDPGEYTPEQRSELESALEWRGSELLEVAEIQADIYALSFRNQGQNFRAYTNLSRKKINTNGLQLMPFETLILKN